MANLTNVLGLEISILFSYSIHYYELFKNKIITSSHKDLLS